MKGALLDVNLLLALAWPNHQMHASAVDWFVGQGERPWATCATTELAFVRLSANPSFTPLARPPREARELLVRLVARPEHRFVLEPHPPTSEGFGAILRPLVGSKQVTDAWLVFVAQSHGLVLATFDARMASWAPRGRVEAVGTA